MNVEEYRAFCLSLKGTNEGTPFGEDTLVLKVLDKMFALFNIELFNSVNLKCDPERAVELREKHEFVIPGYHMNKKHWNSIVNPEFVSDEFLKELTIHSYELVVSKMTKKEQEILRNEF
jgi:predicted DNA-binding protein (MmcQ/YjbR family)